MEVRTLFSARQLGEVRSLFSKWKEFLSSDAWTPISPEMDFPTFQTTAMYGYLLGDYESAKSLLLKGVEEGFPPDWTFEIKDDRNRQWKNCMDGASALPVGLAAHILGLKERRDEIFSWTVERLLDAEIFTEDEHPQHSDVILDRAYALLAAGRYWPRMDADLARAAQQIQKATDNTCEMALPKTLIALVQCQKGNMSRQAATASLVELIRESKRDVHDRVEACFHALYLQSAFPDVFDQVLPSFPTHA